MEQLEPAASEAPQAFVPVETAKSDGFVPAMLMLLIDSSAVPVLESVAARAEEVVPTVVLGNGSVGVRETTGVLAGADTVKR